MSVDASESVGAAMSGFVEISEALLSARPLMQITKVIFDVAEQATSSKLTAMAAYGRIDVMRSECSVADQEGGVGLRKPNGVHRGLQE